MAFILASKTMDMNSYNNIRGRKSFLSKVSSKSALIPSSIFFQPYLKKQFLTTSLTKNLGNLSIVPTCPTKTIVRKEIPSVRQLTISLLAGSNILQTRHLPLIQQLCNVLMMMSLTFNYHTILIDLLNQTYGIVISDPSPSITCQSICYSIP